MNYIEADGVRYYKPNMAALEGEWGRRIIEEIVSTPRHDYERYGREAQEILDRILEAKRNGTF